jgi:hypothetical protein
VLDMFLIGNLHISHGRIIRPPSRPDYPAGPDYPPPRAPDYPAWSFIAAAVLLQSIMSRLVPTYSMLLEYFTISYMTFEHYLLFATRLCFSQVVLLGVVGDARGMIDLVTSLHPMLLASRSLQEGRTRK